MIYTDKTKKAMKLCFEAHKDQVDKNVPYLDYVAKLRNNPVARAVKLADLTHNSDPTRLDVIDEKAKERLDKYQKAIAILKSTD